MRFRDMISMALGNLSKRKVRTMLTVSGVVIGTCAIVVMLSLGIGIKQSTETMMQNMGDLTVININGNSHSAAAASGETENAVLNDKALEKIRKLPHVVTLTPISYINNVTISSGKYEFRNMIYGVYMNSLKDLGYTAEEGELPGEKFKETDILFGSETAYSFSKKNSSGGYGYMRRSGKGDKKPKPNVDPMTDRFVANIELNGEPSPKASKPTKLNVLGVLAEDWSKNPSPGDCIMMDVSLAKKLQKQYEKLNKEKNGAGLRPGYDNAVVKVASVADVEATEQSIKDMGFETYSMDSTRKPLEDQMRKIQMILGGLGAISLLVAALGITNTMIMSIYERTREIGIMKVLGCVVRNIRTMFLIEAGAIGFLGGTAGIGLSYGISFAINTLAAQQAASGDPSGSLLGGGTGGDISVIPLWLALGALAFATTVGLVSGFHPANRAVKISALTAIKQE